MCVSKTHPQHNTVFWLNTAADHSISTQTYVQYNITYTMYGVHGQVQAHGCYKCCHGYVL